MKKSKSNKNDRIITNTSTTGSYGISGSSNLTSASGQTGNDSNSIFPHVKKSKNWSSKTDATINLDPDDDSV